MKSLPRRGWTFTLGLLLVVRTTAHSAVTLKIATLAPEGSAWMRTLEALKADIAAATSNEVRLRLYPGGVMGEEKDVLVKIQAGQLDGAGFLGNGIARICPEANALMLPLVFENFEEVDAALRELSPYLEDRCAANGYIALGWTEVGFSYLFSTREIATLEDFRKARVWSIPNEPMLLELFRQAGVHSIPVPVADVLTALQTGMIDTVYAPPLAAITMQWTGRMRYRTDLRLAYSFGGLFVSRSSWSRIAPPHQQRIRQLAAQRVAELTARVRKDNEEALQVMARQGIRTVTVPDTEVKRFEEISTRTRQSLVGKLVPADAMEKVEAFLRQWRTSAHRAMP